MDTVGLRFYICFDTNWFSHWKGKLIKLSSQTKVDISDLKHANSVVY